MRDVRKGMARVVLSFTLMMVTGAGCLAPSSGGPPGEQQQMDQRTSEFRRRFTADFASAVESGQPILKSLNEIARREPDPEFRAIITDLAADIEAGGTLSGALAKHPSVFDAGYVDAVKTGEQSATLDLVLRQMAEAQQ